MAAEVGKGAKEVSTLANVFKWCVSWDPPAEEGPVKLLELEKKDIFWAFIFAAQILKDKLVSEKVAFPSMTRLSITNPFLLGNMIEGKCPVVVFWSQMKMMATWF